MKRHHGAITPIDKIRDTTKAMQDKLYGIYYKEQLHAINDEIFHAAYSSKWMCQYHWPTKLNILYPQLVKDIIDQLCKEGYFVKPVQYSDVLRISWEEKIMED